MGFAAGNLAFVDHRREGREEVHHRARAFGPDARAVQLLIVNVSPHGMMARCEREYAVGDRLRITLPVLGVVVAEVRWCLGGRLGCQFEPAMDLASYYELLAMLMKSGHV